MKKIIFFSSVCILSFSVQAQLKNTRWKGTIKGDNPRNVILDFKNDGVSVYTVSDSEVVETMTYTMNDTSFTLKKIEGQSDCDNNTLGKYRFRKKKDSMFIKMISDACDDRSSALTETKWIKWKDHPEIKLSESVLKQYVGEYEFDAQHHLFITYENGSLYIEGPNNNLPKSRIYPETETRFFIKIAGVEIDFAKDAHGKVIKFISHEEKDYELKKIK
ncbi:MAG TPA: DUF3471 domain-containing protein [Puia sp.]|nr:DUF3471 domain-containing protein [Puia sp.]